MATNRNTATGFDLNELFGAGNQAAEQQIIGTYLSTEEKTAIYKHRTPLTILKVGERTSFRWQKPEWVLSVRVGNDPTDRLLTFQKGTSGRDSDISKMLAYFHSSASLDTAKHLIPITGLTLTRDTSKRSEPWGFARV